MARHRTSLDRNDAPAPTAGRRPSVRGIVIPAVAAALAAATGGTWLATATPDATAADLPAPVVTWTTCPAYSDAVLNAIFPGRVEQVRPLVARLECGTVSAPLDYRKPGGRQVTIAVTRLKATDRAHRLGVLAFNPGGPGGSGYLMPIRVTVENESAAQLNERHDLIGFDPRGVGNSTKMTCPVSPPALPPPGPLSEQTAKSEYDAAATANAACVQTDPGFLSQLNTPNVARDLDRIRAGLDERRLNFFGVSWGTWLGTVYRSLFPRTVDRMFLDSVLPPVFVNDALDDGQAAAVEREARRLAAWMADRNDTYGFGTTADRVRATLLDMERDYDANPRTFTDLPVTIDAGLIAQAGNQFQSKWPTFAEVLKELRAATGPTAPPAVKAFLSGNGGPGGGVPADLPELYNKTMEQATVCGDDPARPDFAAAWATFQRRVANNPVSGPGLRMNLRCAGWSVPGQSFSARRTDGSLVLSGHRYETVTPYGWAQAAHDLLGGVLYTVENDVHGSAYRAPSCAADLASYFNTGHLDTGCDGVLP